MPDTVTTLITILKELTNEVISFLRYFAAPLVGVSIAWMADADHNVIQRSQIGFPMIECAGVTVYVWVLLVFLAVFGIATYSAHRAVYMPLIGEWIHGLLVNAPEPSMDEPKPSIHDLSFARWRRRAASAGSPARVAQSVLDRANAATDFLYCSCWTTLILSVLLDMFFPGVMQIGDGRLCSILAIPVVFWLLGFWSHCIIARLDWEAYKKFG
jgi:hypothetical protein